MMNYLQDKWCDLKDYWRCFCRACTYFRRGWGSYDYDWGYALDDLVWKLERMKDYFKKYSILGIHYGSTAHKYAKQIDEVVRLLKRVMEDDYTDKYEAAIIKKYGERIWYTARHDDAMNSGVKALKPHLVRCHSMRDKENYKNYLKIRTAEKKMYDRANADRQKDWTKALELIRDGMWNWWD